MEATVTTRAVLTRDSLEHRAETLEKQRVQQAADYNATVGALQMVTLLINEIDAAEQAVGLPAKAAEPVPDAPAARDDAPDDPPQ